MFTVLNFPKFSFGVKVRGWCGFYYLNEAGCRVVQVGPFIVEVIS